MYMLLSSRVVRVEGRVVYGGKPVDRKVHVQVREA
jgi:hypothetical protein